MKFPSIALILCGLILCTFGGLQWYAAKYEGEEPASLVVSSGQRAVIRFRPRPYTENEIGISWLTPQIRANQAQRYKEIDKKVAVRLQLLDNRDRIVYECRFHPMLSPDRMVGDNVYLSGLNMTRHHLEALRTYTAIATVLSADADIPPVSAQLRVAPAANASDIETYHMCALCLVSAGLCGALCGFWLHMRSKFTGAWSVDTT
jgi:hypothetical protein